MTNKIDLYELLVKQIKATIEDESDLIANLSNVASLIHTTFNHHWTGYYFNKGDELVLGPFQGPVACTRISIGKGVCGSSAIEKKTYIVDNVHEFPGHIACSSQSNSEIVVPIVQMNKTAIILDIDSTNYSEFDETDQKYLEIIMSMIKEKHYEG
jgi:L-methionine (R)-S-oxide reductase